MASLVGEHRPSARGLQELEYAQAQYLWGARLAAPQHVGSSQTRD